PKYRRGVHRGHYVPQNGYPFQGSATLLLLWRTPLYSREIMAGDDKQTFVAAAAVRHGEKITRFMSARLRHAAADVPDLVQEVFLRLLRVERPETIRSPEAYLFTIARHVLHQHRVRREATPETIDI